MIRILSLLAFASGCGLSSFSPPDKAGPDGAAGDTSDTDDAVVTAGELEISPSAIDFGEVAIDGSGTSELLLTNRADRTLVIASIGVDGDTSFTVDSTTTFPASISEGAEQVVTIAFQPTTAGSFSADLEVEVSGVDDTARVPLSGVGLGGGGDTGADTDDSGSSTSSSDLALSTTTVAFGSVYTNVASSEDVTLTNTGTSSLLITDISTSDSVFTTSGPITLPQVVAAGSSKTLTVTFEPTDLTAYTGTVTVTTDEDGGTDLDISVTGTGAEPPCIICDPTIEVSTGGSDDHQMNFTSWFGIADDQTITIYNVSDVDLAITGSSFSNDASSGVFTITGLSATTVAAGASTTAVISYTCNEETCVDLPNTWTDENILHIESDDPVEPDYTIDLYGGGFSF